MKYFIHVTGDGTVLWGMTMLAPAQENCESVKVTGQFDERDALPLDEGWFWAVIDSEVFGPRTLVVYKADTDDYRYVAPLKKHGLYEVQPTIFQIIHLGVKVGRRGYESVDDDQIAATAA